MAPFPCGHTVNQPRVARMLEALPFPASKKKLCADCRTKTPEAIFEILNKINDARVNNNSTNNTSNISKISSSTNISSKLSSSSSSSAATPTTPRTPRTPMMPPTNSLHINSTTERSGWLSYLLDRLLAHRRTLTKDEGKEGWMARLGEWSRVAFLCVGDDDDLKGMCDALRQKHGSAAEEEALRSLARAALRAYDVDTPNEPATHRLIAGLNDLILAATKRADEARTFAQVRAVFASAAALRKLAFEVTTGAALLYDLFDDFDRASTPVARRGSLIGRGGTSRTGSRRAVSEQSGRLLRTPGLPQRPL
ncbi:hypothetical protein PG996_007557 [Apiospora saccharicola]|uniref:Uncharacterized protein n=1 Tax=Apiospora saccharicola TaxID=335842 RepID=A0ABR1VB63_9PEZI